MSSTNILIIAEKPSVAASIAKVTGAYKQQEGYLEGSGTIVTWCLGHLIELANPDEYDEAYRKWNKDQLPILPTDWKTKVTADKKKQFSIIKKLMERSDVTEIVEATDAGREGELIFRLVYDKCGCKKPIRRLWISSLESDAIKEGLKAMKDGSFYDNLYQAALCRERADWLIGINATRLYSCLYNVTLNTGRVMTPTLAMLTEREEAIESFIPEPFYTLQAMMEGFHAESDRIKTKQEAEDLLAACRKEGYLTATRAEEKERREKPPALYDLTTLQRDANRLYGYTAKQTLDIAQSLYEKKLSTYPRTDSRYLTDDMENTLPFLADLIREKYGIQGKDAVFHPKNVVNGKKVTDHHAIIPTKLLKQANLTSLTEGERTILQMIALRFLAAMADPYRYLETTIELSCAGHTFKAKGRTPLSLGWKQYEGKGINGSSLYQSNDDPDNESGGDPDIAIQSKLPSVKEGDVLKLTNAKIKEGKTSPPKHYTEGSLLAAMERAGAGEIPDEAERKGIGTSATRAGIIEKLVQKGFAERKGDKKAKHLIPTEKGRNLVKAVPSILTSPSLTADWEKKLLQVEQGTYDPKTFLSEIEELVKTLIRNAKKDPSLSFAAYRSQGKADTKGTGKESKNGKAYPQSKGSPKKKK